MKTSKFSKKEISIKWKLFGYFSAFSIIMLVLLWVFQIVLLDDFYRVVKTRDIYSTSQSIQKHLDSENLTESLDITMKNSDISVSLFDKDGQLVYSSSSMMNSVIHRIPSSTLYSFVEETLKDENEHFEQFSPMNRMDKRLSLGRKEMANSILLTKRIYNLAGNEYILVLNSTIEPVFSTRYTLRSQLIYITLIMIFLSFVLSLIISKKIAKPIENINESAKKLATDYNVKFEDHGYKEISELAGTLNYASEELSKVENLRRELVANVSHDLRTPLTMITGYAEVMRDVPGENTPENVQVIVDESKRLTSLVNDILDISKLQSGNLELNMAEFNLTQTIEEILERYSKLIEKDGYVINFEKNQDVTIKADELKITQVIYNLINNAITYTGEDKTVTIKQTVIDSSVKIEVIDTGNGVSDEDIKYVWDRYYKSKEIHKRAKVGTGLGLSIVKNILTMHEATYGVKNNEPSGADFWFELRR